MEVVENFNWSRIWTTRAKSSFSLQRVFWYLIFYFIFYWTYLFWWNSNWHILLMINHYLNIFNWKWFNFDIWFLKNFDIWFLTELKRSSVKVFEKKYSENKRRRHQTPKSTISSFCFSAPKFNFQQLAFEKKSNLFHTIKNHGGFKFWMNMNCSSVFTGH